MPSASNLHRSAATFAALDLPPNDARNESPMPPSARLWLALASMRTDEDGRTQYGAHRYSADSGDTLANGQAAIDWLNRHTLIVADHTADGIECWRLTHHDWAKDHALITGDYHPAAGQRRDGLPPAYGRPVSAVIGPNGPRYRPPSGADWRSLADQEHSA